MNTGDRCLSLIQPWAELVVRGLKRQETRSWNTKYRGELFIHSSGRIPKYARELIDTWPFDEYEYELHTGAIIGCVILRDVITSEEAMISMRKSETEQSQEEYRFGDYSPGRFVWLLSDFKKFDKPIPAKGSLGIWTFKS